MSGSEALELGENHVEHPDFKDWMATAVVDLPNGGFLFSVNPRGSRPLRCVRTGEVASRLARLLRLDQRH